MFLINLIPPQIPKKNIAKPKIISKPSDDTSNNPKTLIAINVMTSPQPNVVFFIMFILFSKFLKLRLFSQKPRPIPAIQFIPIALV